MILLAQCYIPSGNPNKCHEEILSSQPMIPPKRFDIPPPLSGGCSGGLDAFRKPHMDQSICVPLFPHPSLVGHVQYTIHKTYYKQTASEMSTLVRYRRRLHSMKDSTFRLLTIYCKYACRCVVFLSTESAKHQKPKLHPRLPAPVLGELYIWVKGGTCGQGEVPVGATIRQSTAAQFWSSYYHLCERSLGGYAAQHHFFTSGGLRGFFQFRLANPTNIANANNPDFPTPADRVVPTHD